MLFCKLWSRKLYVYVVCDDPVFYFISFMIKISIAPAWGVAVEVTPDDPSVWVRLKKLRTQLCVGRRV